MNADAVAAGLQTQTAGQLPFPGGAGIAHGFELVAVNEDAESARSLAAGERRCPVVGAGIYVIPASACNLQLSICILDGYACPMGKKVCRARLFHELLVERPAAVGGELFGLEEYVLLRGAGDGQGQK